MRSIATQDLWGRRQSVRLSCRHTRQRVPRMSPRGPWGWPRSGNALVEVMKPGDLWDRHHAPERWRLPLPWPGRILLERLMRTDGVVVGQVRAQQATEMGFAQNDEVIQALAAD